MPKKIEIIVTDLENPEVEPKRLEMPYDGDVPNDEEWDKILAFEDEHVGGRPIGR